MNILHTLFTGIVMRKVIIMCIEIQIDEKLIGDIKQPQNIQNILIIQSLLSFICYVEYMERISKQVLIYLHFLSDITTYSENTTCIFFAHNCDSTEMSPGLFKILDLHYSYRHVLLQICCNGTKKKYFLYIICWNIINSK